MKTIKIFSLSLASLLITLVSFAQSKKESIKVNGNCGMCETKIEKAAKEAGATSAEWDSETKMITVEYNSSTTNAAKIQQAIAKVGYDTRDFKATNEAYDNLHACCKYDRTALVSKVEKGEKCCDKCEMKDGKCASCPDCKDKDCCKNGGACTEKGCCSAEKADGAKAAKGSAESCSMAKAGEGKSCCSAH